MNFYLDKYGFLPTQLNEKPTADLRIIVVIPCYNEPDLISSLEALEHCDDTSCGVEIIVVLNSSETESKTVLDQNARTAQEFELWNKGRKLSYHLIHVPDLPKKHAGVGLARKIGMDEAVARFDAVGVDGIISCFDADSLCDSNYLREIEQHFQDYPKSPGCSIYFEHPIAGSEFSEEIYEGIINYELHLRYYKQALQFCGLPYAYHTVGSSMAVRSSAYQKQGGMNKRKAGEDFYFIHKIIALGGFTELNSTRVIPSPRSSERVPFGTGRAIQEWLDNQRKEYLTYNFKSFEEIKAFVELIPSFYKDDYQCEGLSPAFIDFLEQENFSTKLEEIKKNTTDLKSFTRRFFVWFDAFKVLKLVHCMRDNGFENEKLNEACQLLSKKELCTVKAYLHHFRQLDRT